jgi:hypothetical protein
MVSPALRVPDAAAGKPVKHSFFGIDFCFRHDKKFALSKHKRSADMQSQWSHTGTVCRRTLLCLLMLALQSGSLAAGPAADSKESSRRAATSAPTPLTFTTSFISLSPGHSISPSLFVFGDANSFEIKIPGVDCRESSGTYEKDGLMFAADFSATVIKQDKHYRYAFSAKGILLFDRYIAGTMALDELINETGQEQKVSFVFWGTSEAADSEEQKTPFPF